MCTGEKKKKRNLKQKNLCENLCEVKVRQKLQFEVIISVPVRKQDLPCAEQLAYRCPAIAEKKSDDRLLKDI